MDRLTPEQRRKNMQAVKPSGSEIEKILIRALRRKGYYFALNVGAIPGKPDIVFRRLKIAVFCDSEFWHGKNWHVSKNEIKSSQDFWIPKIESNIRRDRIVNRTLKKEGWTVLRFWGKDIIKHTDRCITKIEAVIQLKRNGQIQAPAKRTEHSLE